MVVYIWSVKECNIFGVELCFFHTSIYLRKPFQLLLKRPSSFEILNHLFLQSTNYTIYQINNQKCRLQPSALFINLQPTKIDRFSWIIKTNQLNEV